MSEVVTKNNFLRWCFRIPREFTKLFWIHVLYLVFDGTMVEELGVINAFGFFILGVGTWHYDVKFAGSDGIVFLRLLKWIISINSYNRFWNQTSLLQRCCFNIFLHFLSKHRFKSFQNFIFIILFEHIGKLCDLFTLFTTSYHFISVDMKFDKTFLLAF